MMGIAISKKPRKTSPQRIARAYHKLARGVTAPSALRPRSCVIIRANIFIPLSFRYQYSGTLVPENPMPHNRKYFSLCTP
jgi:hypothetical protein